MASLTGTLSPHCMLCAQSLDTRRRRPWAVRQRFTIPLGPVGPCFSRWSYGPPQTFLNASRRSRDVAFHPLEASLRVSPSPRGCTYTTLHIYASQGKRGNSDKYRAIPCTLSHAQHLTSAPPRAQDCLLHIPTCPRGQTPEVSF